MLGSRGCTEWLPAQRIRTSIQMAGIRPAEDLRCVLGCFAQPISASSVENWLLEGELDLGSSGPRETPQRYVFQVDLEFPLALTFLLTDTGAVAHADDVARAHCGCL